MRRLLALAGLVTSSLPAAAQPDDAALGLFTRADKGHCIACHQLPDGIGPATRANLGPLLRGQRMRELGREKLREVLADPQRADPQTVMPPYGRHRILQAEEIERLVEFLHALP